MNAMTEKANGLRRAVEYGMAFGKKNIIADLDVLTAIFRGEIPVGGNELPPEEVTALLYQVREQRNALLWASKKLWAMLDEIDDTALGEETDRVFARWEFADLRAAIDKAEAHHGHLSL